MKLLDRIANGTTTVMDAKLVSEYITNGQKAMKESKRKVGLKAFLVISAGLILLGLVIGGLFL